MFLQYGLNRTRIRRISFSAAAVCFAAGTVIDIDHVLDYYFYSGRLSLSVSEISGFYPQSGKVFVFLHSYELLLAGVVVAHLLQAQVLFMGAADVRYSCSSNVGQ